MKETILKVIFVLGVIAIITLIVLGVYFGHKKIKKILREKNKILMIGDVNTSVKEGVLFYIIDNLKQHEEYWNANLDSFRLYASGKNIPCRAFKADDIPNGIRVALVGLMNSTMEVIHVIGAVKFNIWECSFDGGNTRVELDGGVIKKKQLRNAVKVSRSHGYDSTLHAVNDIKSDKKASEKGVIAPGSLPKHGLLAHINEGKTTGTTMRYQIIVPQDHPILDMVGDKVYDLQFYHIYEGNAYRLDSKFIEHTGSLYEFDIINLKPGKIYVGLSTSIDSGESIMPSSSLYGITKDKRGDLPQIDEAELAKPEPGSKPHKMWNEKLLKAYVGEQYAKRMYDVIVKKHYEDEYADKYISLSRSQDFYDDYKWLKGWGDNDFDTEIHIARKLSRVQEEHGKTHKVAQEHEEY